MTREPPLKISRDEISAVYTDGEAAVISLVESLVARIYWLEARVKWVRGLGNG